MKINEINRSPRVNGTTGSYGLLMVFKLVEIKNRYTYLCLYYHHCVLYDVYGAAYARMICHDDTTCHDTTCHDTTRHDLSLSIVQRAASLNKASWLVIQLFCSKELIVLH